jgi:murein DD-endopeptidase MepM/ murein hydrolase activator NlpD
MGVAMRNLVALLAVLAIGLVAGAVGVGAPTPGGASSASAFAIRLSIPGQPGATVAEAAAPGAGPASASDAFVYPADGSAVRAGASSSSTAVRGGDAPSAHAVSDLISLSLFNGELTAESVAARAKAVASPSAASADAVGSELVRLTVLGQPVTPTPNQRIALGDWGVAIVLEQGSGRDAAPGANSADVFVAALHVTLVADHGGLPAGTEIQVGYAEAAASAPTEQASTATTATTAVEQGPPPAVPGGKKPLPRAPEPKPGLPGIPGGAVKEPPSDVLPQLTAGGYVFPIYGNASFTDTFGAARAQVGWHHGEDIFAPLGAPILAVADGTVFSVGWNDIGGYRFWLRDRQGNQFYYAHLSAFSPLAVNGNEVRAGDVIGFVGNTGDAEHTPPHLHFEIHPVAMLPLGYDGVVNAYPYLAAWRRLQDVSFAAGRGWAPPVPANATAPRPGAILLQSADISTMSGLEPGSLRRALVAPSGVGGDGALVRRG